MKNANKTYSQKYDNSFAYYSKLLKEPFNTIDELKEAEEAYYAKQKAKEDKAAMKKADALKVEESFKALNKARKEYKEQLSLITENYTNELKELKAAFESARELVEKKLAHAEATYSESLKVFNEKYPEGFHITLKDGDFETTISKGTNGSGPVESLIKDFFDLIF